LLEGRFADVEPRAEYWAFPDVGEMSPAECLPALGRRVGALVDELVARSSDAPAAQA
jgi:hypothetical protein